MTGPGLRRTGRGSLVVGLLFVVSMAASAAGAPDCDTPSNSG